MSKKKSITRYILVPCVDCSVYLRITRGQANNVTSHNRCETCEKKYNRNKKRREKYQEEMEAEGDPSWMMGDVYAI